MYLWVKKKDVIIFDLDGTIIETDKANFLSYKCAIKQVKNIDIDIKEYQNKRFTRVDLYKFNFTQKEIKFIIDIKNKIYASYLKDTNLYSSILDILTKFKKRNSIIILATNSSKIRANLLLEYYNLKSFFDYIFCKEDYLNNNKFEFVCNYLNLDKDKILVFENEKKEIENAISIGIDKNKVFNLPKGEFDERICNI